jgi:RNA polymerase sigma-70 factor (ECF subfamily)
MAGDSAFGDLIRRVRAGEERAAAELVRRYEKVLRLAVHVRLTDPELRRLLDSGDICQSVLASFFVRAAAGQYELETPAQLLGLLTTMARNKLLSQVRKHRAACRDYRRGRKGLSAARGVPAPGPDPGEAIAHRELLQAFRSRLSAEERWLAEQRALGRPWAEIAAERGENPNTQRARLGRAVGRVLGELGLAD